MEGDVEIQKSALYEASTEITQLLGSYRNSTDSAHRGGTGVGNPVGRAALRTAIENALGELAMTTRVLSEEGSELSERLVDIVTRFEELDASLGSGWDWGDDADVA